MLENISKKIDYPWLLSTQRPRMKIPGFLAVMKQNHLLQVGIKRAKTHLHDPTYNFPSDFQADAAKVFGQTLQSLSHPAISSSREHLSSTMVLGLTDIFIKGRESLMRNERVVPSFVMRSEPVVNLKGIHLTYGPYPVPEDHIAQVWIGSN